MAIELRNLVSVQVPYHQRERFLQTAFLPVAAENLEEMHLSFGNTKGFLVGLSHQNVNFLLGYEPREFRHSNPLWYLVRLCSYDEDLSNVPYDIVLYCLEHLQNTSLWRRIACHNYPYTLRHQGTAQRVPNLNMLISLVFLSTIRREHTDKTLLQA